MNAIVPESPFAQKLVPILRSSLVAGLFFVPLICFIVTGSLFFPFITGKGFVFRILIEILTGVWVMLMILAPRYRPKPSLLLWAMVSLVAVMVLSTIFSANPYRSFWSNFERMEGLISHLHLFLFFLIAGSVLRTELWWRRFFKIYLGVSFVLVLYGALQLFNKIPIIQGSGRAEATFGNATYFATFLLITIFLSLYLWWQDRGYRWSHWVYGSLFTLQILMLFSTQTRGAVLGIVIGLATTLVLTAWLERKRPRLRRVVLLTIGGLVLIIVLFLALRQTPLVQENQVLRRLATVSLSAGQSRFLIWQIALRGFKENPVLGWGPENFILVFNKYYNPQLYGDENWFDRAHNIFLDWLVHTGLLGFLSYISLYVISLYFIWRRREADDLIGPSILTGLFAAYLIQNLFVFDNLTSYFLFFSVLAYLHYRDTEVSIEESPVKSMNPWFPPVWWPAAGGILMVALVGSVYFGNLKPLFANRGLIRALSAQNISESLTRFEEVLTTKTLGTSETRIQLASATFRILESNKLTLADKQKFFEFAESQLKLEIEASPDDARYPLFLGLLLRRIGRDEEGLKYLQLAQALSPTKQILLFELAATYFNRGEKEKALQLAEAAYRLAPQYDEAVGVYAQMLAYNNRPEDARVLLSNIVRPSASLINTFVELGDLRMVLELWQQLVNRDPRNVQYRFSLAATYLQLGERQQSIKTLEEVVVIDPSMAESANYLIKEIRSGRNPIQ